MQTIKEYAESRGKTSQAVYQQIRSKENSAVKDHIHKEQRGNRLVKVIDQEGIAILDAASRKAPIVIEQTVKGEEFTQLQMENESLRVKIMELQQQVIGLQESLLNAKQDLLEAKEAAEQPKKRWWKFGK